MFSLPLRRLALGILVLAILVLGLHASASADDWNQFRGGQAQGITAASRTLIFFAFTSAITTIRFRSLRLIFNISIPQPLPQPHPPKGGTFSLGSRGDIFNESRHSPI